TKFKSSNLSQSYNELVNLKYVLPKRYNDEYKMTRFFKRTFMTLDEVNAYSNGEKVLLDYKCDGLIIDLITQSENDRELVLDWIQKINDDRIIVVVPKEVTRIKKDIAEYKAIEYLKLDDDFLKEDAAIESQLDILFDDIIQKITEYINNIYDISNGKSFVYIDSKKYSKLKTSKLSMLISDICRNNFTYSPIINNELINKQEISSPIKKARSKIIDMILDGSYRDFDSSKTAVECTLFRATLLNKGLLKDEKEYEEDIKLLLKEIRSFILTAGEKEVSFEMLYTSLISNEKKIGIRKGILPIYLAFILKDYKEEAIIYLKNGRSKKELVLETSIIDNINLNPREYLIKLE
ncbi:MAG: hypothetical protein UCV58_02475, partial [Clostridium saudiense]|nr:hypothetical protein [Clostridium saudiense]